MSLPALISTTRGRRGRIASLGGGAPPGLPAGVLNRASMFGGPEVDPQQTRIDSATVHPDSASWISSLQTDMPGFFGDSLLNGGNHLNFVEDTFTPVFCKIRDSDVDDYGGLSDFPDGMGGWNNEGYLQIALDAVVQFTEGGDDQLYSIVTNSQGEVIRTIECWRASRIFSPEEGWEATNFTVFDADLGFPQRPLFRTGPGADGMSHVMSYFSYEDWLYASQRPNPADRHFGAAMRCAIQNSALKYRTCHLPGTHATSAASGSIPYAARMRLKSSYSLPGGLSQAEIDFMEVWVNTLKLYGMYAGDGSGPTQHIRGCYSSQWPISPEDGLFATCFKNTDFEFVLQPSGVDPAAGWDNTDINWGNSAQAGADTGLGSEF